MRKILSIIILTLCLSTSYGSNKIIVAYVDSDGAEMPNPTKMTHINYAFGEVGISLDCVELSNPERLRAIAGLKRQNSKLSVLLTIGGYDSSNFLKMASNSSTRAAFVKNCAAFVRDFKIDGIDLAWELPGVSWTGIAPTSADTKNFTLLVRELRDALGNKKLLTLLTSATTAQHVDFKSVNPFLDFVNIMTFDMERPPSGGHHSALHPSRNAKMSVEGSVKAHIAAGIPKEKIIIGVPFYAHANTAKGYNDYESYTKIDSIFAGHNFLWDEIAKMPYITDRDDNSILCVYDNVRSIGMKCEYVHNKELGGMMYWINGGDGPNNELRNAVWRGIMMKQWHKVQKKATKKLIKKTKE